MFAASVFTACGLTDEDAAVAAEVVVNANVFGIDTHGVVRLSHYARRLENGTIRPRPEIRLERTAPSVGIVHGGDGLGHVTASKATLFAAEICGEAGTASVTVRESSHFGIAGHYVRKLTSAGLAGMATTSSDAFLIPFAGTKPFFGTNPIAYGFPTSGVPVVLDMATTSIPYGKVVLAQREGRPIPEDWGFDADGKPTTDPSRIAGLHPVAGPKGSGLAMVIDIFSSLFSGMAFGPHIVPMYGDMERPRKLGHFISAWDIGRFVDKADFIRRLDAMIEELHAIPAAEGFDRVLFPGEIEAIRAEERMRQGVPLEEGLLDELSGLGARLGIPFPG